MEIIIIINCDGTLDSILAPKTDPKAAPPQTDHIGTFATVILFVDCFQNIIWFDCIDEHIMTALSKKEKSQTALIDAVKADLIKI